MKLFRIAIALLTLASSASLASAQQYFVAHMWGWEVVPPVDSPAIGSGYFTLDAATNTLHYHVDFVSLSSGEIAAAIHGPASSGQAAPALYRMPLGSPKVGSIVLDDAQEAQLIAGQIYVQIDSTGHPAGEIRGQINETFIPPPLPYCFGDDSGTDCPCGNASAVGAQEGCLNSFGTGGKLQMSGVASVALDNLVLTGTGMTNGAVLFFQGTQRVGFGASAGAVFGDGLRCVAGTVVRLATKTSSGGASSYPQAGDPPISLRGGLPAGGVEIREYQAWYRNSASFCQPAGFNLTNGVEALWIP